MAVDYTCRLPAPQAPIVDKETGIVSEAMWQWMLKMWTRAGGNSTGNANALNEYTAAQTAPGVPITLGPSPFVYTATGPGSILVAGSGMVRLEITAGAVLPYYGTGRWYGAFPMNSGAQARLTYTGAVPILTFIPG
jgi:hypothetical protein